MSDHRGLTVHDRDQCAAGLAHAARLLHEEFDDRLGPAAVEESLAEVTARFADATVLTFVPLLVRRYARDELLARLDTTDLREPAQSALLASAD